MAEPGTADPARGDDELPRRPGPPLPIAISQCLLGSAVRYDGSAAGFAFPHAALAGLFEYRGICPEVGIGLGTPRAPIRLVGRADDPRVVGVHDPALDVTERLRSFGRAQAAALDDVAGYVFMRGSPSCGLFDVKVHPADGSGTGPIRNGRGAHAAAVVAAKPNLPVEENGRLHDPLLRESFVVRTFTYAHWLAVVRAGVTRDRLLAFHRRYEYVLMAHGPAHARRAARLLAGARDVQAAADAYIALLMSAISRPASRRGHAAVLERMLGRVRRGTGAGCLEIEASIRGYRRGELPLAEPLRLIRRVLGTYPDPELARQVYLQPPTAEL